MTVSVLSFAKTLTAQYKIKGHKYLDIEFCLIYYYNNVSIYYNNTVTMTKHYLRIDVPIQNWV